MIPEKDLEELKARADIVQVIGERIPLKRAGRHFKALCPFHSEKTPSFMVNPERQIYHCFGCGEGGNVLSFIIKFEGLEFVEAVHRLADRFGFALSVTDKDEPSLRTSRDEKDLLYRINRLACRFFYDNLLQKDAGQKGREYLEKRGIRDAMIREALLGHAPADGKALTRVLYEKRVPMGKAVQLGLVREGTAGDHYDFFRDRLLFPILSADNKILGFSGRALDDAVQPKYLNSPESPIYHKGDSLLGIHLARASIREKDEVVLVEGNFDWLRLFQEGIRHTVAPLGTALTEPQVRVLSRLTRNFVLLFDSDEAGIRAANRALEVCLPLGMIPRTVLLPAGEDPDSFVKKLGAEPLLQRIQEAPLLLDDRIERIFTAARKDPQGTAQAIREVSALLSKLPGEVEKTLYIQRVSERFGLSQGLLMKQFSSKKDSNFLNRSGDEGLSRLPPIERMVLEVLLSGSGNPVILFEEIGAAEFTDPDLARIWDASRRDFERHGELDASRILLMEGDDRFRKTVAALSMGGSLRMGEEEDERAEGKVLATTDCIRRVRTVRIREKLKNLSREIRQAEGSGDPARLKDLLDEKNQLIKEMQHLH